ncbi:MAG: hypothetical protein QME58_12475 [Bacteroidota bacterium]|nr:hypothetical protein [Bacteroidota bacterium]
MKNRDQKIIWQSSIFPKMVLTDKMLEVYWWAYPRIKSFRDQLLLAEAWLVSNPDRVPIRLFGRFINNWMRTANKIITRKEHNI